MDIKQYRAADREYGKRTVARLTFLGDAQSLKDQQSCPQRIVVAHFHLER